MNNEIMKTKIMQFIASLLENWRDEKQLPKDRPEIIPVQNTPVIEQQTKPASATLTKPAPVSLTEHVNAFLQSTYDFRYNLLTEETEYRPAGKVGEAFSPVGKRELNTLCLEAHAQGIACWDKDISRYLYSTCVPGYHPFTFTWMNFPLGMASTASKRLPVVFLPTRYG